MNRCQLSLGSTRRYHIDIIDNNNDNNIGVIVNNINNIDNDIINNNKSIDLKEFVVDSRHPGDTHACWVRVRPAVADT